MDNLFAGIRVSSQWLKRPTIPWVIPRYFALFTPNSAVAAFTGIGGSFEMESVAAFKRNRWQASSGIHIME